MTRDPDRTEHLRQAVAAGDWAAVLHLWSVYAEAIRVAIEQRTCTPARMAEAKEFLDWTGRLVQCERAHTQARLDALHAATLYATGPDAEASPTVRTSL